MFRFPVRKLLIFLFFGLLSVPVQFSAFTESAAQSDMQVTIRTEDGAALPLYKHSYALVIGNGTYPTQNGWHPLPGAVNDVKAIAEVLEHYGFTVALKIDVTTGEFKKAFSEFIYEFGKDADNRLLFYYAGHAYTTKSAIGEDLASLVMLDTPRPENPGAFDLYSIDMVTFVSASKKIHAKHVLFMFDSCFSSTILNLEHQITPVEITDQIRNPVRQFIIAGRANEPMPERSAFKTAFLDMLEGRVKEPIPDGYLTSIELGNYLYQTVPNFSQGQHPRHGKIRDQQSNTGDFVFVLPQNKHQESRGVELETIARLDITSIPNNATVYIDGAVVGTTPLEAYEIDTGALLEKQVNVGLEFSGYKSRVQKITLYGGQQFSWDAHLEKTVAPSAQRKLESNLPDPETIDDVQLENSLRNENSLRPSSKVPQTILGADTAPMVLIPAGEFQMGSDYNTIGNAATRPMHVVYLDAFYIDTYEVTIGQYNQFVRATNYRPLPEWAYRYSPTDAHPVVGVSWHDAKAYAKWAGKRLPTEAEWEKAARGGLVQNNHAWGNAAVDGTQGNFADKHLWRIWDKERKPEENWADENIDDGHAYTAPVGSYPPNGYGLYDMEGNVREWCFDAYDENFYANLSYENPIAEILVRDGANNIVTVNKLRVVRGASWYDGLLSTWIAVRLRQSPEDKVTNIGFRCVKSVTP